MNNKSITSLIKELNKIGDYYFYLLCGPDEEDGAQKIINQIEKKNWDKRVLELYKKISDESEKIKFDYTGSITQECPLWICSFCGSKHQNWQYICSNCNSIDSIQWSKIKNKSNAKVDIYFEFLKNSFRQLPKMK